MADDDLLDLLMEFQHDLGKYLRLPLTMLPRQASQQQLREALDRALRSTRKGPTGVRAARDIWQGFVEELGEALGGSAVLAQLEAAVARALSWERVLDDAEVVIDRALVTAELSAVGDAFVALIEEQRAEPQKMSNGEVRGD